MAIEPRKSSLWRGYRLAVAFLCGECTRGKCTRGESVCPGYIRT